MFLYPNSILLKSGFASIRAEALRHCRTQLGAQLVNERTPDNRAAVIKDHLNRTSEMLSLIDLDDPLPIDELPDLRPALKKSRIRGDLLDPDSILQIARLCSMSRLTLNYFKKREESYPLLRATALRLVPAPDIEKSIGQTLDDHGNIKDGASTELRNIRHTLVRKRNHIRTVLNRILQKAFKDKMTTEEGITIRGGRMVIPVLAEHKRHIPGFVHDVSATGQTVYLEPAEALDINNEIRQLEGEEKKEIERLIRQLTALIGSHSEVLAQNLEILGNLDAVYAIAALGLRMEATIPRISEDDRLELHSAYNPVLVLRCIHSGKPIRDNVVPLDLRLGNQERCLIITGPNAGGKSVAMKTVGLCALMLQCGYAVPVSADSQLPVFSGISLDQGDDQSVENDISTFSSRLIWMRETVKNADTHSLILIDEAGSGTDPEEGSALYQAFLETLIGKHCQIIVTTHHGNLKTFAHHNRFSVNGSMEFDHEHLTPTYRFRKGQPGGSYAFEIARRLGLPEPVIKKARKLLGSSKNTLESLIVDMEKKMKDAETIKEDSERIKKEADARRHEYEDKRQALIREQDNIREKALIEARNIILNANKQIEETVRQIKEDKAGKTSIKKARAQVRKEQERLETKLGEVRERRKVRTSSQPPSVGDTIRIEGNQSLGELVEIKDSKAVVIINGMRLKTDIDKLVKVKAPKKPAAEKTRTPVIGSSYRSQSATLDIRGQRGEDAVKAVTNFIDRAVVSGLHKVEIIHGKGEGILKQLVHDYLAGRDDVRQFDIAPWDSGGPGCTIVVLGN